MRRFRVPFLGHRANVEKPVTVDQLDILPRPLRRHKPTPRQRFIEFAICAAMISILLALMGIIDFHRYQPARDLATIEQLVAELPETFKFAVVERGGRSYVIWIGRPRGVIVSGPPVCVFDAAGVLVDRTSDAGDSDNRFVIDLYSAGWAAPGITAREALEYCRKK